MSRPRGGVIGKTATVGPGVWTVREVESLRRAGEWSVLPGISGLELWLDGSDANTLYDATTGGSLVTTQGSVARWEDKSGNGRHLTQSTSGRLPVRVCRVRNGRDGLRFDGSDDHLLISTLNVSSATAASLVVAGKYSGGSGHQIMAAIGTSFSYGALAVERDRASTGGNKFGYVAGSNSLSSEVYYGNTNSSTSASVFMNVYGSGVGAGYLNDAADGTAIFAGPINSTSGFVVGSYYTLLPANCDVYEVLYYSKALSQSERTSLYLYLADKWGI